MHGFMPRKKKTPFLQKWQEDGGSRRIPRSLLNSSYIISEIQKLTNNNYNYYMCSAFNRNYNDAENRN